MNHISFIFTLLNADGGYLHTEPQLPAAAGQRHRLDSDEVPHQGGLARIPDVSRDGANGVRFRSGVRMLVEECFIPRHGRMAP